MNARDRRARHGFWPCSVFEVERDRLEGRAGVGLDAQRAGAIGRQVAGVVVLERLGALVRRCRLGVRVVGVKNERDVGRRG